MKYFGFDVVLAQPLPRYVLPTDVPPPTGMTREEFAEWSKRVCGVTYLIPRGQVYTLNQRTVIMHPLDFDHLRRQGVPQ